MLGIVLCLFVVRGCLLVFYLVCVIVGYSFEFGIYIDDFTYLPVFGLVDYVCLLFVYALIWCRFTCFCFVDYFVHGCLLFVADCEFAVLGLFGLTYLVSVVQVFRCCFSWWFLVVVFC